MREECRRSASPAVHPLLRFQQGAHRCETLLYTFRIGELLLLRVEFLKLAVPKMGVVELFEAGGIILPVCLKPGESFAYLPQFLRFTQNDIPKPAALFHIRGTAGVMVQDIHLEMLVRKLQALMLGMNIY